tara:strand:+ start:7877 stop:8644 length:768 start_codon:yes stop_codon:yes gene_type:complete
MESENDFTKAKKISKKEAKKDIIEMSSGEGGLKYVMWLDGKAPEQHNDQPVNISGTITAPRLFLDQRKSEFYAKTAHAIVSRTDGEIKMVINEHTVDEKYTVTGQIEKGKKFVELGINTYKNGLTPLALVQKLRLRRSIFKSVAEWSALLTALSNVEATVQRQMDEEKDDRGNHGINFKQTVTSNIPKEFTLVLPLIEGEDAVEIEVFVILEVDNSRIVCYLESVDGADLIETAFETLVNKEVKDICKLVTVIYR